MNDLRRTHHLNQRHERRRIARLAGRREPWRAWELWQTDAANPCGICGGIIHDRAQASIDHITPVSRGGTDERANIQLAHARCNWRKGSHQPTNTRGGTAPLESLSA